MIDDYLNEEVIHDQPEQLEETPNTEAEDVVSLTEHRALEQKYKTLQGQFKNFEEQRKSFSQEKNDVAMLKAQLDDMKSLLTEKQSAKEPDEPLFDDGVAQLLGDQKDGFERAMKRIGQKSASESLGQTGTRIAELEKTIQELKKQVAGTPFEVLRSTNQRYDEPAFQQFLADQVDPMTGESLKDMLTMMHSNGRDVIPMLKRVMGKYESSQHQKPSEDEIPITPQLSGQSQARPVAPKSNKVNQDAIRKEYSELVAANKAGDRSRRIELVRIAASNGFNIY